MDERQGDYYVGTVLTAPGKSYGWINIASVTMLDGSRHNIPTTADIYLPWGGRVPSGRVMFRVAPDMKRGEGYFSVLDFEVIEDPDALQHIATGGIDMVAGSFDGSRTISTASACLSWCMSPELAVLAKHEMREGNFVKLLLVYWSPSEGRRHSERRMLVDFAAPVAVVPFAYPGKNRVVAILVKSSREDSLYDTYTQRENGFYCTDVLGSDDTSILLSRHRCITGSGVLDLEIPEGVFAKKPWDYQWVNAWFRGKPRDECDFRRRRFKAYPIQAGWLFLQGLEFLLDWSIVLSAWGLGVRGIHFDRLKEGGYSLGEIFEGSTPPAFMPEVKDVPILPGLIASPTVLLPVALISWLYHPLFSWAWFILFLKILLGIGCLLFVVTLLFIFALNVDWSERKRLQLDAERAARVAKLDAFTCDGSGPRLVSVRSLPWSPKTIRLHFAELKAKICQNFPG